MNARIPSRHSPREMTAVGIQQIEIVRAGDRVVGAELLAAQRDIVIDVEPVECGSHHVPLVTFDAAAIVGVERVEIPDGAEIVEANLAIGRLHPRVPKGSRRSVPDRTSQAAGEVEPGAHRQRQVQHDAGPSRALPSRAEPRKTRERAERTSVQRPAAPIRRQERVGGVLSYYYRPAGLGNGRLDRWNITVSNPRRRDLRCGGSRDAKCLIELIERRPHPSDGGQHGRRELAP